MGRNLWVDEPANFEKLRQNFTTSLCIDGPNMNLPEMSEKLVEMRDEMERLRAALGRSAFLLSRAADACADGDLSDPRIDDLSAYAAEIEGMYQKSRSAADGSVR